MYWRLREILTDLFAGSTNVIQTPGQMYQSLDLPRTPPRTSGSNAVSTWLLREAGHSGTSEPGNTVGGFALSTDGLQVVSLARTK